MFPPSIFASSHPFPLHHSCQSLLMPPRMISVLPKQQNMFSRVCIFRFFCSLPSINASACPFRQYAVRRLSLPLPTLPIDMFSALVCFSVYNNFVWTTGIHFHHPKLNCKIPLDPSSYLFICKLIVSSRSRPHAYAGTRLRLSRYVFETSRFTRQHHVMLVEPKRSNDKPNCYIQEILLTERNVITRIKMVTVNCKMSKIIKNMYQRSKRAVVRKHARPLKHARPSKKCSSLGSPIEI